MESLAWCGAPAAASVGGIADADDDLAGWGEVLEQAVGLGDLLERHRLGDQRLEGAGLELVSRLRPDLVVDHYEDDVCELVAEFTDGAGATSSA